MKSPRKLEPALVGVAGEYYVAAELSLRGCLASITLRNSRGIDILASNKNASRTVSIQVKSNTGRKPVWMLNKKAETFYSDSHFYVFVLLEDTGQRPRFYVVPSPRVATFVSESHKNWLSGTKRDGTERKDTSMRKFHDPNGAYEERWELLGL